MAPMDVVSTAQAADISGRSVQTILRWIHEGALPSATKLPGRTATWLISRAELDQLLNSRRSA